MKAVNILQGYGREEKQLKQVKTAGNDMATTEFSFQTVPSRTPLSCLRKLRVISYVSFTLRRINLKRPSLTLNRINCNFFGYVLERR